MKVLTSKKQIRKLDLIPVREMGSKEPVGYLDGGETVETVEEWRCGYCNSLVVAGKTHCPKCGGEY